MKFKLRLVVLSTKSSDYALEHENVCTEKHWPGCMEQHNWQLVVTSGQATIGLKKKSPPDSEQRSTLLQHLASHYDHSEAYEES